MGSNKCPWDTKIMIKFCRGWLHVDSTSLQDNFANNYLNLIYFASKLQSLE